MKKNLFTFIILSLLLCLFAFTYSSVSSNPAIKTTTTSSQFLEGDIIFQTSNSLQSQAIQIATQSKYSHVGIIMKNKGKLVVFEAVQPVKLTPIDQWIKQGEGSTYSLKRLKNREEILTEMALQKMRIKVDQWIGKNYDIAFDWSDKKLYCSELVWKLYKEGCGIEVGKLKQLKEYDLSHPVVKKAVEQRYGKEIPWDEKMISPQAIFESKLLKTVN